LKALSRNEFFCDQYLSLFLRTHLERDMSDRRHARTQFMILALFGDYILQREGWAWTGSLIRLLGLLGVSSQAVRSTLSRMSRHGWLKPQRAGRNSLYALTPKARRLLEEGERRIYEPRGQAWDGQWRVVVYSLPEAKCDLREALRRRLSWLGFGPLAPGTWVSPRDRHCCPPAGSAMKPRVSSVNITTRCPTGRTTSSR
jgi:DNA-binding transcriptional regulator PaaX